MIYNDRGLSEEQRMMRDACRAFVNDFVTPCIVKSPVRIRSLPFFSTFVLLNVRSGNFATSKKSAVRR